MKQPELSDEATKVLLDGMSKAIEIYNSFHAGKYESRLMELIGAVKELTAQGYLNFSLDVPLPNGKEVKIPFELIGLLVASTKHMGDMCMKYGGLGKDRILRSPPGAPPRRHRRKPKNT